MSNYIISPLACRDLDEICDFFVSRNIEAGERFVEEFEKKCRNLVEFPNMGRSYAQIKPSLRGIPLEGYYSVSSDGKWSGNCLCGEWISRFTISVF